MNTISVWYDWKYEYRIDPMGGKNVFNVPQGVTNFENREGVKPFLQQHEDAIVAFDLSRSGVIWTREYM